MKCDKKGYLTQIKSYNPDSLLEKPIKHQFFLNLSFFWLKEQIARRLTTSRTLLRNFCEILLK